MNEHLISEIEPTLSQWEQFKYQTDSIDDLTDEQRQDVLTQRHVNHLFDEQSRLHGYDGKYVTRPLPGDTLDEKWMCLKAFFENDKADHMNMLMGSTSGIHGSYTTLDDLEMPDPETAADNAESGFDMSHPEAFTFVVIQPRVCRLTYGTIGIRSIDDMNWLRNIITQSIAEFAESQVGNTL